MLYPIRVDVTSNDGLTRLIDSILVDPSCLPLPPSPINTIMSTTNNDNHKRLHVCSNDNNLMKQTIERNSIHLATALLADMEVHSCTRIYKSGRVNLLQAHSDMKEKLVHQIRDQLAIILEKEKYTKSKKRKIMSNEKNETESKEESKDDGSKTNKKSEIKNNKNDDLIKIHIRLRENQISVLDEFMLDPNDEALSNPITIAESIAKDLNIPEEMINTIAISIAEQTCGLDVDGEVEGMMYNQKLDSSLKKTANQGTDSVKIEKAKGKKDIPAAWVLGDGLKKEKLEEMKVKREVPAAWTFDDIEYNVSKKHYLSLP